MNAEWHAMMADCERIRYAARMDSDDQPRDERGRFAAGSAAEAEAKAHGTDAPVTFSSKPVVPKASLKDDKYGDYDHTPFKQTTVKIADLHPSQHTLLRAGVDQYKKEAGGKPSVVEVDGKLVVTNGHHRIQAAHEKGETHIDVDLSRWYR